MRWDVILKIIGFFCLFVLLCWVKHCIYQNWEFKSCPTSLHWTLNLIETFSLFQILPHNHKHSKSFNCKTGLFQKRQLFLSSLEWRFYKGTVEYYLVAYNSASSQRFIHSALSDCFHQASTYTLQHHSGQGECIMEGLSTVPPDINIKLSHQIPSHSPRHPPCAAFSTAPIEATVLLRSGVTCFL